ncbi:uncharacterized protein LOC105684957 [Athalia rosae]|uniref:uncharacterized protein LOC105684957 n=1 Tax=Athalia rosae TaxID=37344 RepID=UPI00203346AE|nr:uncharacterized protein LOC105684957 [Athalia rosae]XP_048515092.1 uncharacterized protein LOC105684957 [Athalia rosae]
MEDQLQAISFANSYFSLVDGLAPGLEDHLDENVVLDWFGKTIRGRENVTAFMKAHNAARFSRHKFNRISPVPGIVYRKSQATSVQRSRRTAQEKNDNSISLKNDHQLNFERLSISDPDNNNVLINPEIFDLEENEKKISKTEELSMSFELHENDLANLFALDVTPTKAEEIEDNINKIKEEEKSCGRTKFVRREYDDLGAVQDLVESKSIKYVEAIGQIKFSKRSSKRGTEFQTWQRQSKIQIAYSMITSEFIKNSTTDDNQDEFFQGMETDPEPPSFEKARVRSAGLLPSLDEIAEISNNLVPNINNFGGYLTSFDFVGERDNFLENFNAELAVRKSPSYLRTPQYIDNRLVFRDSNNQKKVTTRQPNQYQGNGFVFNYLIHLIIYQAGAGCRRSLSQEFN